MNKKWSIAKKALGVTGLFTAKCLIALAASSGENAKAREIARTRARVKYSNGGCKDIDLPSSAEPSNSDFK